LRIVLFGAGASYGCGDVTPRNPPLGRNLFNTLQKIYKNWRSIPGEAANQFSLNFEEGMANVIDQFGFAVGPLMQEMALFFSIFHMPSDGNNRYYDILELAEERNDILWSSLNYDCIFETAAAHRKKRISYFPNPNDYGNDIPFLKLHGSCNFRVSGLEATRGVQYSGTGVVFGGGIEPIDPGQVSSYYRGDTALYPAMALYTEGKSISMSPSPILSNQKLWQTEVLESDRILIVGVLPNIKDDHIWSCISASEGKVGYIGDVAPFEEWKEQEQNDEDLVSGSTKVLNGKFSIFSIFIKFDLRVTISAQMTLTISL